MTSARSISLIMIATLAGVGSGCVTSDEPDSLVQAERIASQVDRVAPAIAHATRLGVEVGQESYQARSERLAITIPRKSSGWVKLERPGKESKYYIGVGLPFAEIQKPGVVAQDGTVIYLEAIQATDVAVQAFDHGVRIQTVLNDDTAPSEFVYAIDVPADGRLVMDDHGGVLIIDDRGALRGGFAAPWAFDNKHRQVPTHYEVRGNTVVQIVEHADTSLEYPIVADPWMGINLIAGVTWVLNPAGWTMQVSPTAWARSWGTSSLSYSVGVAGWSELSSAYYVGTNPGGFQDQYICHQQFAFAKSTWNLDEWRPNVSYAATVAALCNP